MPSNRFEILRHDVTQPLDPEIDEDLQISPARASPVHYQADPIHTTKTSVLGRAQPSRTGGRTAGIRIFQASTSEVYGDP